MSQAITLDQYRAQLSDPDAAVAVILSNNPEDVAEKLRNMGLVVSGVDGLAEALNTLLAANDGKGFVDALSVPVRKDRISADELEVLTQTSQAMMRANGGITAKSLDLNALFAGLATGTLAYLQSTGATNVQPGAAAGATPPVPPKKDNTTMWIVGGIAALILVVIVIVVLKKTK
jgi:hypothetical protein